MKSPNEQKQKGSGDNNIITLYFASSISNFAASLNMSVCVVHLPFTFQNGDELDIISRHLIRENQNSKKIVKNSKIFETGNAIKPQWNVTGSIAHKFTQTAINELSDRDQGANQMGSDV